MTLEPQYDTTEEAFRQLEREVRQRECRHSEWVDVTSCGDPSRTLLCTDCGLIREEPTP